MNTHGHTFVHHGPDDDEPYCSRCNKPLDTVWGEQCQPVGHRPRPYMPSVQRQLERATPTERMLLRAIYRIEFQRHLSLWGDDAMARDTARFCATATVFTMGMRLDKMRVFG